MRKTSRPRPRYLTIGPLRRLLAEWQARLGLQGHVVDLSLVRAIAFNDHDTLGDCDQSTLKRRAVIRLLDGQDGHDPEGKYDDHETVLVHELLHVLMPMHLFAVKVDLADIRYQLYEQAIDQLARTLIALKRGSA